MTFLEYLRQSAPRHPFVCDFTADALRDRALVAANPSTLAQVERHIRQRSGCREAFIGARRAWRNYERALNAGAR